LIEDAATAVVAGVALGPVGAAAVAGHFISSSRLSAAVSSS
jgi:hypothetical protein